LLLALFFFVYARWSLDKSVSLRAVLTGTALDRNALPEFAEAFFYSFLALQFLAACVLTPLFTAGAITEDKECRTLEDVLSTDRRSWEIVLGKSASRFIGLLFIFLTGLPFVALMQVLGGIDSDLFWAGFAVTGITMISLTALGTLVSVYARRNRQAIAITFALALAYIVAAGASWLLLLPEIDLGSWPSTTHWKSPVELQTVVEWLNAGNPFAIAVNVHLAFSSGAVLRPVLTTAVRNYALAHGLAAILLIIWPIWRFRAVALREATPAHVRLGKNKRHRFRPRIGNWPMVWKELFTEPSSRLPWVWRLAIGVIALASFLPIVGIAFDRMVNQRLNGSEQSVWDLAAVYLNLLMRVAGTVIACLMLITIAFRAAGSVSAERDRQTLDSLLSTSLGRGGILFAKWLSSIAAPRLLGALLAITVFIALWLNGLDSRAMLLLAGFWLLLAMFLASLGLFFSVKLKSSQRSLQATFVTLLALGAGHWLLWILVLPVLSSFGGAASSFDDLLEFQAIGLTPPLGFMAAAIPAQPGPVVRAAVLGWLIAPLLRGCLFWGVGAALLYFWANAAFQLQGQGASRLSRGWRIAWAGASAVACLIIGWWLTMPYTSTAHYQRAAAEADRLDPGWRIEELEGKREKLRDEENSACQVPEIPSEPWGWPRWFIGKTWPDPQDIGEIFQAIPPNERLGEEQRKCLHGVLAAVPVALPQARGLKDFPKGRYPVKYASDGFSTLLPYASRNRQIAFMLGLDMAARADDGDVDGALDSCRAGVNAARSLGDEPTLVSMLVRNSCRTQVLTKLERVLAQGQPSESALAKLQEALETEETAPLLLIGMRGERAMSDRFFESIQTGQMSKKQILSLRNYFGELANLEWSDLGLLLLGLSVPERRAQALEFTTQLVEAAKSSIEEQPSRLAALAPRGRTLPPVTRIGISANDAVANAFQRNSAMMRCAFVAVALERYRLCHNKWPESLDALLPKYLACVPTDPFDGKPLRYRRLTDGAAVYSIGDNKSRYGGDFKRPFPEKDPQFDLGFRLWSPAQRCLPAKPFIGPLAP
jgi:ABC-type transport system involved in multi-copper enzyme maturation permease subunit